MGKSILTLRSDNNQLIHTMTEKQFNSHETIGGQEGSSIEKQELCERESEGFEEGAENLEKEKKSIKEKVESLEDDDEFEERRMFSSPYNPTGRISRTEYVITAVLYVAADLLLRRHLEGSALAICDIALSVFFFMQGAKRCHDVGISGWWQIIPVTWLWLLVARGHSGHNDYGAPPYLATEDDMETTYTITYLRGNTQMGAWLIFFLGIMCLWVVYGTVTTFLAISEDGMDNGGFIKICQILPSILAMVWTFYMVFAYIRRLPNAIFLAEVLFAVLFLSKLIAKVFWPEFGYEWREIFLFFCVYGVGLVFLVDSRCAVTIIPRNFRKTTVIDIALAVLFFLITIGAFVTGIRMDEVSYQPYQEDTAVIEIDSSDLKVGEYTDGIIAFTPPIGFTCEQDTQQDVMVSVLTTDSAQVTINSGIESNESESNFILNYCPNYEYSEYKNLEQHEVSNSKREINGNTYFIQEKYYVLEEGIFFWRLIALFDSESDKACVVSCYDNGNDQYLKTLLSSIRFK